MHNGKKVKAKRKSSTNSSEFPQILSWSSKDRFKNIVSGSIELTSLLFLQFVSLATTLDGAKLLFQDEKMPLVEQVPIAYALGFGIQLLLIGILVFNAFEKKSIRRLFALVLLSAFSIYTNFFSIYNILNGGLLEKNTSIDLAQRKYEQLVVYFYTNPENELSLLEQKAADLKCSLYQEDPEGTPKPEGCLDSGFNQGKGDDYYEYKAKLDLVNAELRNLNQDYITKTAPDYFDKSIEQKDARYIFELSQKALMNVPLQIKNKAIDEGYKPEEYDAIDDFLPEKETSYFLIPAQKVFNKESRETTAVIAFMIATAIDGISLLLGAKLDGFYTSLKKSLFSINPISDILNGLFSFLEAIGKSLVPFMKAPLMYLGRIWFSLAEGGGSLIASIFKGFGVVLISLLDGIADLFKDIINSLHNQRPGKKLSLEPKNGDGVEFLDTFHNAVIKGRSDLLNEDSNSNNFQLYQALIGDMSEKGYFEKSRITNGNYRSNTNGSRPDRFERENHQNDLILKPESTEAFHNWYVNQRYLQLERERRNVGRENYSLNTLEFPPAYQKISAKEK